MIQYDEDVRRQGAAEFGPNLPLGGYFKQVCSSVVSLVVGTGVFFFFFLGAFWNPHSVRTGLRLAKSARKGLHCMVVLACNCHPETLIEPEGHV
jgi:hypothetical protein